MRNNKDILILGSGSNSVFVGDFDAKVILNRLKGRELSETADSYVLNVAAGEDWHEFVTWCTDNGYWGLENLALIPGTVGASPIQNIGAYGVEICKFISKVDYFDLKTGKLCSLSNAECQFAYRDSIFKSELKFNAVISNVEIVLPKDWQPVISYGELAVLNNPTAKDIYTKVCEVRRAKLPDPTEIGNAGSFFKNPIVDSGFASTLLAEFPNLPHYPAGESKTKLAAGWLIDQAGLKGFSKGQVGVHVNQALVLVNLSGDAHGPELIELMNLVQRRVLDKFGVALEPEVRMFGQL